MGTKDSTQKRLEDFNDVFADIVNVLLFDGKQIIKEDELETVVARDNYMFEKKVREIERDVAKSWKQHNIHITLFGLENQTAIDSTMPMRIMCYDGAAYRGQLSEKRKPYPVISLVLYMGTDRKWKNHLKLSECFKVDPILENHFHDYEINVFNLAWLPDETIMKFKSDFRNLVEYLRDTRLKRNIKYSDIELKHIHEMLLLMKALANDNSFEKVLEERTAEKVQKEGEKVTMAHILDNYYAKKIEAAAEAAKEAEKMATEAKDKRSTAIMHKQGISCENIAIILDRNIETIKNWVAEFEAEHSAA